MTSGAAANTDRELWRETEDDYYAPSIHVTAHGGIGINVGGYVTVMSLRKWHALAAQGIPTQRAETRSRLRSWVARSLKAMRPQTPQPSSRSST